MERGWGRLRDREGGEGVRREGKGRMTFTEHFTLYKAIGSEKYVNFEIFVLY